MSDAQDSIVKNYVVTDEPSTFEPKCTESIQTRNSITTQDIQATKKEVKVPHVTVLQKEPISPLTSIPIPESSIQSTPKQSENLHLESRDIINIDTNGQTGTVPKKKNRRKKEKYKLQVQIPNSTDSNIPQAQPQIQPQENVNQNGTISVQDFFIRQVTPLYAATSSRYLENLTHHPQFRLMQSMQYRQMVQNQLTVSAPNTPITQNVSQTNPSISMSFPCTPEVRTPKFLQNVMQHPLLRYNYANSSSDNYNLDQNHYPLLNNSLHNKTTEKKSSPRQNKHSKNSKQAADERYFTRYMTNEEVELGLKNNILLEGVLRINPKQFQHAYVSSNDRSEQDILIDGVRNRNRALEGDIVVVQYIESENEDSSSSEKQKTGRVVYIKEKVHSRTCIGTLKLMQDKNRQKALFVPRDFRIPRLNIPFTNWPNNFYEKSEAYENTLFSAKILDWNDVRFANGQILSCIGVSGDMQTETRAILAQTDLDVTPFGPEFRNLYPTLDYTIPEEEVKLREDCRNLCIFSIDPSSCRDIDDAVSCRKLKNGNYEVGVHISDVAHFLTENTHLDAKVAEKATTVYVVERAYHMLPDELCMLCSLFPGVDKLAFSVFWEITEDAKVLSHRFAKTVINSCAQLAYEHAQAILDDEANVQENFPEIYNGVQFKDIYDTIKILGKFSAIFRTRRFDGGALRIDQPKVAFKLSPLNGLPESFSIYESKESHQLIEEFMLLSNMTVAKRILDDHPKIAFLRCHPPPSGYMLKQLAKSLIPMGIELDIESAGDLHKSLLPYVGPENTDRGKAMVLNMLCAKPMTRAKYFCAGSCDEEDFNHYALNVPLYTHFTSPIRRYADIMVHRLLAASLNYRDVPKWEIDTVRMVAAQCNKQKYNAKKAGELSTELYTLKYIELNSPVLTEAVVVEVKDKYIDVIITAMGLNRRIFFNNDFPGEHKCIKSDAGVKLSKMELIWEATDNLPSVKQVIEVFSILQVEMHKGDDMVKVETKLVRPN